MQKADMEVAKAIFLLCIFHFVSSKYAFGGPKPPTPPKWPKSYTVNGTLSLPYAELEEPFAAYYDAANNRSRLDMYGDTMQTFMRGDLKPYGISYKIAFMTNKDVYNKKSCFQNNGTKGAMVTAQSILPDLTNFTLLPDTEMMNDVNVTVWYKMVQHGSPKRSKYTMYFKTDGMTPYRYEMYGYDSLLGSHFDKYYVDYTHYKPGPVDSKMFDVPKNKSCSGFPGPGDAESRVMFNPMREYINHDDTHHQEMFNKFKKTHEKQYAPNTVEHARREATFRQNVRFIHSKNRSPISYSLAVNHLADRSREELKLMNGRRPSKGYNGGLEFNKAAYSTPLPVNFDWRMFGAVTPVKDQAVCGSCWSFGSTGTIEGTYFLATGFLTRFSQQELMDCSWGYGNNACDGGEDFRAYNWIMSNKNGLATEDAYGPYMGIDAKCKSRSVNGSVQLTGFVNVTSGDQEALKIALFAHGPISVGIDASHTSLSFYANGVYYEKECRSDSDGLDHAVLAVGYGVQHGEKYWLIKNSWSTYWGNDGYVLMSMKDNNCGVATSATYVKLVKP